MRPGCVHVIVSIRHSGGQEAIERHVLGNGDLDAAVAALRGAFESSGLLRGRRVVVQAAEGPRGAFEHDGLAAGAARWVSDADMARAPGVVSMMPAAIPCGETISVVCTQPKRVLLEIPVSLMFFSARSFPLTFSDLRNGLRFYCAVQAPPLSRCLQGATCCAPAHATTCAVAAGPTSCGR